MASDGVAAVPALSPAEEQERWLHDAFKAVKQHAFYMKRALVSGPILRRTPLAH